MKLFDRSGGYQDPSFETFLFCGKQLFSTWAPYPCTGLQSSCLVEWFLGQSLCPLERFPRRRCDGPDLGGLVSMPTFSV
jgi:hypothetical protein